MPRLFMRRARQKVGLEPGTLVYTIDRKVDKVRIRVIDYNETQLEERELETAEECFIFRDRPTITWINIDGLHDLELMEKIGNRFGLHPLILEDIVHTGQRPKLEEFEDHIFIVLKMLYYDQEKDDLTSEQVSLILGENFVISFQERVGTIFESVRERIRSGKGRVRKVGADYLAYALIDCIVDNYFVILEQLGEGIEDTEQELTAYPNAETLQHIRAFKKDMIFLRKSIWPLREVANSLERDEISLINKSTGIYMRDVYDHTIQIIDTIESYRDVLSGMLDVYLSSISNKMNEVMKVLTIFAAIFIPLTFVAGVYGMNFSFMPELGWRWGYFGALSLMVIVAAIMLVYFRRKRWL